MVNNLNRTQEQFSPEISCWDFFNPVKISFGRGCRKKLVEKLSNQALLVVTTERGKSHITNDPILKNIIDANQVLWMTRVRENPDINELNNEIFKLKAKNFDSIIAFGGGSAIDTAKVINVALGMETACNNLVELLAIPLQDKNIKVRPLLVIPTTAGTGSEVTPFATIWDQKIRKKYSLSGNSVWPLEAYIDPDMTDSVPIEVTISTGLDAINQAAESIWNRNANPITLQYAVRSLKLGISALPKLSDGDDIKTSRVMMSEASLLAGLAISNTRTALCHSISYPITAHFGVPHGLACAFTMPAVLKHNLRADDGRFGYAALAITGTYDTKKLVDCLDTSYKIDNRNRVAKYSIFC